MILRRRFESVVDACFAVLGKNIFHLDYLYIIIIFVIVIIFIIFRILRSRFVSGCMFRWPWENLLMMIISRFWFYLYCHHDYLQQSLKKQIWKGRYRMFAVLRIIFLSLPPSPPYLYCFCNCVFFFFLQNVCKNLHTTILFLASTLNIPTWKWFLSELLFWIATKYKCGYN